MSLALSPDALSIAVASASRLSVHGASAGSRERQYVQQGQLARRYACCAWSKDAALVACGSGDGAVVVWDVKRGLVKATLTPPGALANAGVVGVDFSADGAELYACYALPGGAFARHVARWAVAGGEPAAWDGDKRGVSALAAHPSGGAVAVGSTRVRLLQTTGTGAKRALAGTHATEVRRLAWTASGRYVVSLARDARSVLVHDCTKAKDGVWSLRLAAPGLEVCARAAPRAEGEEAVEVAVCLGDGRLQVASTRPRRRRSWSGRRERWPSPSSATTSGRARRGERAVGRGRGRRARRRRVRGRRRRRRRRPRPRRGARRGEEPKQPAVLGFAALGAAPRLRPDGEDGAARKRAKAAAADDDAALGDRLAALEALATREEAQTAADLAADAGHAAAADDGSGASLAAVLDQAVRCGDDALLETVLRRTEPATVAATCAKLAPSLALPTLDALAARLERSPLRAADLAGWVKALLLQHASHLATLPKLADTLARLQYVVDARVAALPKFLSLLGKFDLLLHKKTGAAVSGAASAEVTPLNVVAADATDDEDEDEEDDDMEEDEDDDDESEEEEDDDDGDEASSSDDDE
ncbi:hypothetical protein SO694_00126034 [Aureococcus anophagefferens]|uniref:Small-subunit processome Utp12 domain-containing protein n=1 Tax=Aureococcus anophagefferens TaxID=44056 RepID=A0ABR1G3D3_AURAN